LIADLLFSTERGTGLSCWRFNIGAGINTKIAGVAQFAGLHQQPAGPLTRNGLTNATKGLGATNLKPGLRGPIRALPGRYLHHFRDAERIGLTYVSPVNEPQWKWGSTQEGNRYSELRRASLKTQIAIVES